MPAAGDPEEALPDVQQELDARGWRANWLLSTVWLVFAFFPVFNLWLSDDLSQTRKVAATVIALVFVATYAAGFRQSIRAAYHGGDLVTFAKTAWAFQAALVVLAGVGMLIGSWAMLGLTPYVLAFAVFNLQWRQVAVVAPLVVAFTVLTPLIGGVYNELWVLTPVTIAVAFGMVLIRVVEGREHDRAVVKTELVVSDERNRVARDVHDVLGHSLTAVILKAELTERLLQQLEPSSPSDGKIVDRCRDELAELQAISRRALSEIRSTVGGLRNPTLADEVSAARTVLADAGVTLAVLGDPAEIPQQYRSTLAWVVRESVINVVRHAKAKRCTIEFPTNGQPLARITDDGVGWASQTVGSGNGLRGLRERATAAGTTLVVEAAAGGGTQVEVRS